MAAAERTPEELNRVTERIDRLIGLFNQKGMDLPDGLFDRTTQFLLNGAPYETLVGQSPTDPLILMLTRGQAGYRFIVKAVQHAVPDAVIERGALDWIDGASCRTELWLSGCPRGAVESIQLTFQAELSIGPEASVRRVALTVEESAVAKLRAARHRP